MARQAKRLSAIKVKKLTTPGWYPDGLGLYLQVSPSGSKSWVYRYYTNGKEKRTGLGSYTIISLEEARRKADAKRKLVHEGVDPIAHKKAAKTQAALDEAKGITFRECASSYIESHRAGWSNKKHANQWANTLETYAYPVMGNLSIQDIDVSCVIRTLEPIWNTKTETATRVRQRIEAVIDWAKARDYREGDNPARWKGHLDKLLPNPSKIRKVEHHNALPYIEMSSFFRLLRSKESMAASALSFIILTATRSGEARGARVEEIDFQSKTWTIPAERMKAKREHKVPLSDEAINVLKEVSNQQMNGYIFPGSKGNAPVTEAAIRKLLKAEQPGVTTHGFRSTFRDWCAEKTDSPREVAEAALAHILGDQTESAYLRTDLFDRRRELMGEWSRYCLSS